jgi:hypothetical protein
MSETIVIDKPSNDAGMRVVGKRTIRKRKAANSVKSKSPDDIIEMSYRLDFSLVRQNDSASNR